MELIDIITSVLVYGGGITIVIILITYLFAKSKAEENPIIVYNKKIKPAFSEQSATAKSEQATQRKNSQQNQPIIIYIDKNKDRDLKIVRKSTYDDRDKNAEESRRNNQRKTNGQNGSRYTIVNEQMENKKKPNAMNFYL